jgi:hypothetical protein
VRHASGYFPAKCVRLARDRAAAAAAARRSLSPGPTGAGGAALSPRSPRLPEVGLGATGGARSLAESPAPSAAAASQPLFTEPAAPLDPLGPVGLALTLDIDFDEASASAARRGALEAQLLADTIAALIVPRERVQLVAVQRAPGPARPPPHASSAVVALVNVRLSPTPERVGAAPRAQPRLHPFLVTRAPRDAGATRGAGAPPNACAARAVSGATALGSALGPPRRPGHALRRRARAGAALLGGARARRAGCAWPRGAAGVARAWRRAVV